MDHHDSCDAGVKAHNSLTKLETYSTNQYEAILKQISTAQMTDSGRTHIALRQEMTLKKARN